MTTQDEIDLVFKLVLEMKAAGLTKDEALAVVQDLEQKTRVYFDLKKQGMEHGEIIARLFPEFRQ
jgi:hypothetical protein